MPKSLNPAIIDAICDAIRNSTGRILDFSGKISSLPEEVVDPAQLAMAVAYTNLCLEEPEMVTSSHLKMLRNNFSYEQIQDLNSFIKKII